MKPSSSFKQSVKEMLAIHKGLQKPAREFRLKNGKLMEVKLRTIAVQEARPDSTLIRKRLGLTQAEFAALLRVPRATVRNWEQARRQPAGAAEALLLLADRNPAFVLETLHRPAKRKSA